MSVMPTVSSKWNVGFQAQEQLRTVLLTEWKAAIITGLFISLKMHYENVSEKEPISANEGATKRALK
jgi:hypothetical protein